MKARGFSLIELLIVIAIIGVLAALTIPAFNSIGRSSALSNTSQSITGTLDLARQTALSQNRPVEVRFYKLPDAAQPPTSAPSVYRGMQIFIVDSESTNAVGKFVRFSNPAIMSAAPAATSLIDDTNLPEQPAAAGVNLAEFGANYRYRSFRFKPDGGTDLPLDGRWFLSLHLQNDAIVSNSLPANFVTLQIDPQLGRTRSFQP